MSRKLFLIFITASFLAFTATAQIPPKCIALEGIALPNCLVAYESICHSGSKEACIYAKVGVKIQKISSEVCPPDKIRTQRISYPCGDKTCTRIEQDCMVTPVPTCTASCGRCQHADIVIDTGVECTHTCSDPNLCPQTYVSNGQTYELVSPTTPLCDNNVTGCPGSPAPVCNPSPPPTGGGGTGGLTPAKCCQRGPPSGIGAHLPRC